MKNEDIKKLPPENQKKLVDFLAAIPKIPYLKPDGKPKKEWKVFYGETWDVAWDAARVAARDAARVALSNAAWNAAWNVAWNAAWDATSDATLDIARNAALNIASDIAWNITWRTVKEVARKASYCAAWDAALIARFIVVEDLKFKDKEKHLAHAQARWEVWQKGYGLLCDVDGVLYVYAIGTPKNEKHRHVFRCECGKREDTANRIFTELNEIAEVECGMSLESVLIRMPRNKKSVKKYEALKKKYGVD